MSLNFSITNIINANVISFVVMAGIITYACIKLNIGKVFEKQRDKIKSEVDTSEKAKQDSVDALDNMQKELDELPAKIKELEKEAKNTAKVLVKDIEKDTEIKKQILQSNTDTAIEYHVKIAKQRLSEDVSRASINLAKENFTEILKNNPEIQYDILKECIEKL